MRMRIMIFMYEPLMNYDEAAEEESCFWVALLEDYELLERRLQPTSVFVLQALSTDVCARVAGNFNRGPQLGAHEL